MDGDEVVEVDVSLLKPHPINKKIYVDDTPERDQDLAESIAKHGILERLVITKDPHGDGYIIVSGVRRWRVAKRLGIKKVQCILKNFDNIEVAIIEYNRYRRKTPRELLNEVSYLEKLLGGKGGSARKKIAELVGKSEGTIAALKFINKHKDYDEKTKKIFDDLVSGKIKIHKAKKLIRDHIKMREVREVKATTSDMRLFKYYPIKLIDIIPGEYSEETYINIAKKIINAAINHLISEGYTEREILDNAMKGVIPRHTASGLRLEDVVPKEIIERVGRNPKRIKFVLYMILEMNPLAVDDAIKKLGFALVG